MAGGLNGNLQTNQQLLVTVVLNVIQPMRLTQIIARTAAQKWTEVITMSNDIKTGDFVKCVEMPYYGVSGVVIKQYCPTACEEQTMIRCIDNREFHAPTRCFIKVG